jgi:hypothetical protein
MEVAKKNKDKNDYNKIMSDLLEEIKSVFLKKSEEIEKIKEKGEKEENLFVDNLYQEICYVVDKHITDQIDASLMKNTLEPIICKTLITTLVSNFVKDVSSERNYSIKDMNKAMSIIKNKELIISHIINVLKSLKDQNTSGKTIQNTLSSLNENTTSNDFEIVEEKCYGIALQQNVKNIREYNDGYRALIFFQIKCKKNNHLRISLGYGLRS